MGDRLPLSLLVTFSLVVPFTGAVVFEGSPCQLWVFWVFFLQLLLCIAINTLNLGSSLTVVEIKVFHWLEFKSN